MTVPRLFATVAALVALLLGVSCRDREQAALPLETDEPLYVQGMQLKKVDRYSEALTAFLRVIARRGEAGAPESHLEAAQIYLNHTKDPVEAYHHFKKYLELQPNSKQAPGVRGMVEVARREFARTIPGRPLEDQSARLQNDEEIARLRREVAELRAENATLRGGVASFARSTPVISLPEENAAPPPVNVVSGASAAPAASQPRPAAPVSIQPAAQSPQRPTSATTRTNTSPASLTSGRTHVVSQKDSLWGIARKYYGAQTNAAKVRGIYEANRDVMKSETDVRPGMTLRIP